ncbi:MAG: glycoside hydrolase family 2 TIM barrel-domain containing protein [Gemmatimonadota bacterium]
MSPPVSLHRDAPGPARPRVSGKFFYVGDQKLYIRGVTYGTFRPRDECEFPEPLKVEQDFAAMADSSINAVRTYTAPPRWLLDVAQRHGLRVLAGLPAERYIGYLADGKRGAPDMDDLVGSWLEECVGHPAVLGYSIGNEIPASIARWHGSRRVSSYLERVYRSVKERDPEAPVTYADYPSTEYLSLPFLDFVCFNVFLESREKLDPYLARLQSLSHDRPLLMGEIGLDAYRNGDEAQSRSLAWQIRACFEAGCAGLFVYSWTDEWYRGGAEVDDWSFGLTRRTREPKPALPTVRDAFSGPVFGTDVDWPRISVGVCTYNGSGTL